MTNKEDKADYLTTCTHVQDNKQYTAKSFDHKLYNPNHEYNTHTQHCSIIEMGATKDKGRPNMGSGFSINSIINTPLQVLYGIIMYKYSNHIQLQHEGGLYVVTHECIIPYSACRGVLTGLYPQVWCLSLTTEPGTSSS